MVLGVVCGAALVAGADEGADDGEVESGAAAAACPERADAEVSGLASAAGEVWVRAAQPAVTPARASATPDFARTRDIRRNWHHPLLSIPSAPTAQAPRDTA